MTATGNTALSHPDTSFHIAFCVDNRYFPAMGATIMSILDHNPNQHFTFHVLTYEVSEEHKARFKSLEASSNIKTHLHILDLNTFTEFAHFLKNSHYSLSIFVRLLIPTVLEGMADRVLYLDADILCAGSIQKMIDMDISNDIAAVAHDVPSLAKRRVAKLGLQHDEYFNSGMMFMNIPNWLKNDITTTTMAVLSDNTKPLRFYDQDALNIALNGRARYISPRWNYLYSMVADLAINKTHLHATPNAAFVHYGGAIKPWASWSEHEAVKLYVSYLSRSPWANTPLEDQPKNTKEMRAYSRFLYKRGKYISSLKWFIRYLYNR